MTFPPQHLRPDRVALPTEPVPQVQRAPAGRPSIPGESTLTRLRVNRLLLEGFGPVAPASVRDGFIEAWEAADPSALSRWARGNPETFSKGLDLRLPAGATGREIGRRLARVIIETARPTIV